VKNDEGKTPYDVFNDWHCPDHPMSRADTDILRYMLEHHPSLGEDRLRAMRWSARRMAMLLAIAPVREGNLAELNILGRLEQRSFDIFQYAVKYL
jgi:hypothetical protein